MITYNFTNKLWEWGGKVTWYFISMPEDTYEEIKEITGSGLRKGFGSVKVEVTIGSSIWKTSVFPSKEMNTYILPVKKSVRVSEKIENGDMVKLSIKLIELS